VEPTPYLNIVSLWSSLILFIQPYVCVCVRTRACVCVCIYIYTQWYTLDFPCLTAGFMTESLYVFITFPMCAMCSTHITVLSLTAVVNLWWTVKFREFLLTHFSPALCYYISLIGPNIFSIPIVNHSQLFYHSGKMSRFMSWTAGNFIHIFSGHKWLVLAISMTTLSVWNKT
jgi:hypothetical protein